MGIPVQLHDEGLLHRKQLLHPLPHESQVQVRPFSCATKLPT